MKKIILTSVMFILGITVGVSWAAPKYPNELLEFVKTAKDLSSALEAGVNYEQYGDIVVKLKIVANNAIEKLDIYPEIKERIDKIANYYIDAKSFWLVSLTAGDDTLINSNGILVGHSELQHYLEKYPFLTEKASFGIVENNPYYGLVHWFGLEKACKVLFGRGKAETIELQTYLDVEKKRSE